MTSDSTGGSEGTEGVRLQKVLAKAGIASRRGAEELIAQGRVSVDGEIVREFGRRVDPESSVIHVDGARVVVREDLVYLALNKPKGVHTTMTDDRGRPCVGDFVRRHSNADAGLFHIGRLDADTEGLLLLTNDGELAHRLMHPSYEVFKTYLAEVDGAVPRGIGKQLRAGIELEDGPVKVDKFRVVDALPGRTMVEVVLHEGRKHIVRRLLAEIGHPVHRLVRTAIGDVHLGDLKPGKLRALNRKEIASLHAVVGR
ncbi:MAG: pseudouridine synthase [Actinophytocola sp.]|nr:pseudouridine synthase [Actinophytocola sp.]